MKLVLLLLFLYCYSIIKKKSKNITSMEVCVYLCASNNKPFVKYHLNYTIILIIYLHFI